MLLSSLVQASNALITFKRICFKVDVPRAVVDSAYHLFVRSEEQGVQAGDQTIQQVARRFVAAASEHFEGTHKTRIDEQGRAWDESGRRIYHIDPARVLRAEADVRAGRVHEYIPRKIRNGS